METFDALEAMRARTDGGPAPEERRELDSEEAIDVFASGVRRRLLALLAADEATTGELARALDVPRPNVYHHLERLREAGLVRVSREVTFGRMRIRFYRAVAREFELRVTVP